MEFEFLSYPFMQKALLVGAALGVLFSLMGVFVVAKGMSFFSDFVAHAGLLGGALALILNIDVTLFLIPYSLVLGFAVSAVWQRFPLSRDTVLGVFYGGAVSIGMILIAAYGLGNQSLLRFFLGDILLIRPSDVWLSMGLLIGFAVFFGLNRRRLLKAAFLPEIAEAEGVRVRLYDYALMGLIALAVALSIKLVGALLASAMVVIPAAAAKTVSRSLRGFLILSPLIGVASFTGGTVGSYYLDLPSGPSVAAFAFGIFLLFMALRPLLMRGRHRGSLT